MKFLVGGIYRGVEKREGGEGRVILYLVLVLAVISATFTAICEGHLHAIFAILSMYVLWTHTATFERGRFWRRRRSPCEKRGGREYVEVPRGGAKINKNPIGGKMKKKKSDLLV